MLSHILLCSLPCGRGDSKCLSIDINRFTHIQHRPSVVTWVVNQPKGYKFRPQQGQYSFWHFTTVNAIRIRCHTLKLYIQKQPVNSEDYFVENWCMKVWKCCHTIVKRYVLQIRGKAAACCRTGYIYFA